MNATITTPVATTTTNNNITTSNNNVPSDIEAAKLPKTTRIGIIGAGPAGISAAYFLKKEGYTNVTILESDSQIAGKSATHKVDGRGYDVGALMVGHNYTHVKELAKEFDCPLEKFVGRALDFDTNTIQMDDTDKIAVYNALIPHMNHFLEERSSFEKVFAPGHGDLSERELYSPISQWIKDHKMEYMRDVWNLAYTSAGYGYWDDDIPAAYFLKFAENSENTISYFPGGFRDLWTKMTKDLNVMVSTKVISIDRSLKRANPACPHLVTVETAKNGNTFQQTHAFDQLIIATNPRQTETFIDPAPVEKALFDQVITFDFYTIIATVEGLSTKVGMTTIPKHCVDKSSVGHVTAFYCAYEGVPTYLFYAYGNDSINQEKVTEIFREDIGKMGGELKEIHYNRRWDFFPHVSSLSMARGFYGKVENLQGEGGVYYVGGWLDFEHTESCVSYSKDLVRRFFNQKENPAEIAHLPIQSPVKIKPVETANWGMILRLAAKRFPDKVAFTWVDANLKEEMKITYHELYRQARAVAHYLTTTAGQKSGDRILLCYAPGLKFLPVLFGCMMVGVIPVPISPPNLATPEKDISRFTYLSGVTKAKLVFCDKDYMLYTKLYAAKNAAKSIIGLGNSIKWPELTWIEGESVVNSKDLLDEQLIDQIDSEAVAVIQFSSGSTGDPKGVMLSHKNLVHNVDLMQNEIALDSDSTIAFWVPQFHDLGLIGGFLNTVRGGCKSVVMSPLTFLQKPEAWLQMISDYKATFTAAPNFAYDLATRKTGENHHLDLSSLRGAFNGAEPVRWSTLKAFSQKFGPSGFKVSVFKCLYGLAEHCAYTIGFRNLHDVPTVVDIDPTDLRSGKATIRSGSSKPNNIVSTGVPNLEMRVEVRVVDPVTRQLCSPNTIGEVWINSPSVGKGYYAREDISEEIFRAKLANSDHGNWVKDNGSFLRTGDLGFIYNGELFITGRQKDVIIVNGKNHYPQDIELSVQESHKAIRPGCVAAIHHSNEKTGTDSLIILAEVRNQKTDTYILQEICESIDRIVPANHGLPCERVVILKQHTIPKTTSGKLQRSLAKDMLLGGAMDKKILLSVGEIKESKSRPQSSIMPAKKQMPNIDEIEQKISLQLRRVSKFAAKKSLGEIDVNANLISEYGLDSLTAVQLTSCLKEEFGMEIAPQLLLDLPTISHLANHIFKQLPPPSQSSVFFTEEPKAMEYEEDSLLDEIRKTISGHVHKISKLASKLPIDKIDVNANLINDYGFDSLAAAQLSGSITQSFGIEIAPAVLYEIYTISDLSNHVYKKTRRLRAPKPVHQRPQPRPQVEFTVQQHTEMPVIVPLAPKTVINRHNPTLYCVHPLLGNVATYFHFARLIISRPVYGIQAPQNTTSNVSQMATGYINALRKHQPIGPYYLCGYSFGGLVAWEMACQLVASGEEVDGLYLIDAPAPLTENVRPPLGPDEEPHKVWHKEIEELLSDVDNKWMVLQQETNPEGLEELKRQTGKHIAAMYEYTTEITSSNQPFPIHYWRAKEYGAKTSKLLLDHPLFHTPNFGWERYQGNIHFHKPVPGHHYSILQEENCGRLAREVDRQMPSQSRRGSVELRPLMLESVLNARSGPPSPLSSARSSPTTGTTLISEQGGEWALNKSGEKQFNGQWRGFSQLLNVQIPVYIMVIVTMAMTLLLRTI